jgi:hypothetical protein
VACGNLENRVAVVTGVKRARFELALTKEALRHAQGELAEDLVPELMFPLCLRKPIIRTMVGRLEEELMGSL